MLLRWCSDTLCVTHIRPYAFLLRSVWSCWNWYNDYFQIVIMKFSLQSHRYISELYFCISGFDVKIQDASVQPALVVVFFGANDAAFPSPTGSGGQHVPIAEFQENLCHIAAHLQAMLICYFSKSRVKTKILFWSLGVGFRISHPLLLSVKWQFMDHLIWQFSYQGLCSWRMWNNGAQNVKSKELQGKMNDKRFVCRGYLRRHMWFWQQHHLYMKKVAVIGSGMCLVWNHQFHIIWDKKECKDISV